ncbi:MAG: hypothetical protein QOD30_2590 [Actinomycetota bacterium]|jgi:hypothetical protein|nr:hypothetical protein [Actinomycetota bacterium]
MSARCVSRDESGSVLVETPFAIGIILLLLMGVTTLVQVAWTDLALSSAVRATTRFATHVDYVPGADSAARRRTAEQVKEWTAEVAAEAHVTPDDVTVIGTHQPSGVEAPLDQLVSGDEITLTVTKRVSNPLYRVAATVTNAAAHLVHAGDVFDPNGVGVKAGSSTYVE